MPHRPLFIKHWIRLLGTIGLSATMGVLGACATQIGTDPTSGAAALQLQNRLLLTPASGGQRITTAELQPGDTILSSTQGVTALGIRLLTVSPVRHAKWTGVGARLHRRAAPKVKLAPLGGSEPAFPFRSITS